LLISGLALGQMDNSTVKDAQEFERIRDEAEELRAKVEELESYVDTSAEQMDEIEDLRKKLKQLLDKKKRLLAQPVVERDLEKEAADAAKLTTEHQAELARLRRESEARKKETQKELEKLNERIKELEKEIEEKGAPPDAPGVKVLPSGSGSGLKPTFVECNATAIVIYEKDPPVKVSRSKIKTDPTFKALIDRIADNPKLTIIFLVREDGISTYRTAQSTAVAGYAKNGKLPVVGKGKLDLSMFK